jgi:hypothetical protein
VTELVNLSESTVVKSGNGFCVALRDAGLPIEHDHPLGVYLDDCRHLRGYELRLAGRPPRLLVASDAAGTGAVCSSSPTRTSSLPTAARSRWSPCGCDSNGCAMVDRITLRSYARDPVEFDRELRFDADFRPMLEVRGGVAPVERDVRRVASEHTLTFSAIGSDGRIERGRDRQRPPAPDHEAAGLTT